MPSCKAGDSDLGYWKICPSVLRIKPRGERQRLNAKSRVGLVFFCLLFLVSHLITLSGLSYLSKILKALHPVRAPEVSFLDNAVSVILKWVVEFHYV